MGQIVKLRNQLEPHTRMFGYSHSDGMGGYTNQCRYTYWRIPTLCYIWFEPTSTVRMFFCTSYQPMMYVKSTYKQILYTALERSPSTALLLRIIFFVETQNDTILLRDDFVRWLRAMNRWHGPILSARTTEISRLRRASISMKSKFIPFTLLMVTDIARLGSCKESSESYAQRSRTPLV